MRFLKVFIWLINSSDKVTILYIIYIVIIFIIINLKFTTRLIILRSILARFIIFIRCTDVFIIAVIIIRNNSLLTFICIIYLKRTFFILFNTFRMNIILCFKSFCFTIFILYIIFYISSILCSLEFTDIDILSFCKYIASRIRISFLVYITTISDLIRIMCFFIKLSTFSKLF